MAKLRPARPTAHVDSRIRLIRGERVLLDADLAALYEVPTGHLNQALKRNRRRFPADFAFRLTAHEVLNLKSQFVISSARHGGRRGAPWVYTEHGAIMAASVLNTTRAVQMSVYVVRAFARLRVLAVAHEALSAQLTALERRVSAHDAQLARLIAAVRSMLAAPGKPRRPIGFTPPAALLPSGTAVGEVKSRGAHRSRPSA
jgi:hypothetical protein